MNLLAVEYPNIRRLLHDRKVGTKLKEEDYSIVWRAWAVVSSALGLSGEPLLALQSQQELDKVREELDMELRACEAVLQANPSFKYLCGDLPGPEDFNFAPVLDLLVNACESMLFDKLAYDFIIEVPLLSKYLRR